MYSAKKSRNQSLTASILLHLLLFAGVGFYITKTPPDIRQGEKNAPYITSYLYQSDQQENVQGVKQEALITEQAKPQSEQQNIRNKVDLPQANTANNSPSAAKSTTSPSSIKAQRSSNGEAIAGLLALLHSAIQSKQQYPSSALQMGRQGRVIVGFKLYPNGGIDDLRLIKSSGTSSLDGAALAAVRLAAPFKKVDTYLKSAEDFSIDVVFALDEQN